MQPYWHGFGVVLVLKYVVNAYNVNTLSYICKNNTNANIVMKIQKVKITQVKVNAENPRTITGDKFQRLINSILSLPKMLELRPIVVNERMAALGGNMRLNALKEIAKHNIDWVEKRLDGISKNHSCAT